MLQASVADPTESIFVLAEVPAPVFAIKQQKDYSVVPAQPADGQ
jgi:hypothetical protein